MLPQHVEYQWLYGQYDSLDITGQRPLRLLLFDLRCCHVQSSGYLTFGERLVAAPLFLCVFGAICFNLLDDLLC